MKLDILISTFGERIYNIDNILLPYRKYVHYYICHQGDIELNSDIAFIKRNDVTYIRSHEVGVTRSRNVLIKMSQGDLIYFCDDDITLNPDIYNLIVGKHKEYGGSVVLFNITDEHGVLRKKYPKVVTNKNRFNILSVGTIEISMKNKNVPLFPEDMGAGTCLPIGDEAVFLSKVLLARGGITYTPHTIASHPLESTGVISTANSVIARGVTLKRIFGNKAYFFALIFFIRRSKLFKIPEGYFKGLVLLFKGVWCG
ncbi:glycosyltransferase family 2 protein [Buttiauxella massiliensis]|uniref:glycosyltransferase family 2 protein n=1 Tax=Buttiauxella massiliensis TaxID=2831590 RepID=UPI00125FE654|nr:glycosyltransferase [Buttiauxella massiliensis]